MRTIRITSVVIMAAHGLLHGIGVVLLWHLLEPGTLRYSDAHPTPGTPLADVFGVMWLLAALTFLLAATLLAVGRTSWRGFALAAAVLSIVAATPSASIAIVGIAIDIAVIVVVVIAMTAAHRRRVPAATWKQPQ